MNHLENEKGEEYKELLLFSPEKMSVIAIRIGDTYPRNFRWFVKSTTPGWEKPVLQGQYWWTQGTLTGFEWRDIPTVYEGDKE